MRWLCFLLLAEATTAQGPGPRTLQFELTALPATRDSLVFRFHGAERGWAVRQYEIQSRETTQHLVYSYASEFRPVEEESMRVVLDRVTGAPISSYHHVVLFSPQSDTVMLEHELAVRRGEITGRRRIGTKQGDVRIIPVSHPFPPGSVLADYALIAGAVTNTGPGDSLAVAAYQEFIDSLATLSFVGEAPTTISVPAGRFDVQPIRTGNFRLFATRTAPRRLVKGETLDGVFAFELVHSGPAVPAPE